MPTSRVLASSAVVLLIGVTLFGQQGATPPPVTLSPPVAPMPKPDIEHGRYLVEDVVMCFECHSSRDAEGTIVATTRFFGGPMPMRPPWPADWPDVIPRIAGLPGYTDVLAMRLLTQGAIKRDGTKLRRPMPPFHMSPQDAADVIGYIRSR